MFFHLIVCLLAISFATKSGWADSLFLQLDEVPGESVNARHEKWIEVNAFSKGIERTDLATRPAFFPVAFSKRMDASSPLLANRCWGGRKIGRGTFEVTRNSGGSSVRLLQVNLTNVAVVSFQQSGVGSEVPTDDFVLDYTVIEWVYTQIDATGRPIADFKCQWNRSTGTGVGGTDDDADGDGLPLEYEQIYGLDPSVNDADRDLDGDGATNIQEFRAGTVPNRRDSVFRMTGRQLTPTQVELIWAPVEGKSYKLFAAPEATGPYAEVGPVDPGAGGRLLFESSRSRQFFIIEAQ